MVRPPSSDPLVPQFGRQIDSGVVAAAGDNFVVLYAGPYRPASSSMGCYLVYNAAAAAATPLSTVPGVPYSASHSSPAAPPSSRQLRPAASSSLSSSSGSAPRLLSATSASGRHRHRRPMAAAVGGYTTLAASPPSCCRRRTRSEPTRPSPPGAEAPAISSSAGSISTADCSSATTSNHACKTLTTPTMTMTIWSSASFHLPLHSIAAWLLHPNQPSSQSAAGTRVPIKFVSMDGWSRVPSADITITTWALDLHDESTTPNWAKHTTLRLGDLWADDTFLSMDLPKNKPIFPVLSTRQHDDVVYLVLAVAERHVDGNKRGRTTKRVKHLISVDTRHKKVLFCSSYNSPGRLWPNLIASDFSTYLPGSKDDQRGLEAVEVSAKRMKI